MQLNSKLKSLSEEELNQLRITFETKGAVTIPHFLSDDAANALEKFFREDMPEDWWSSASYPSQTGEISYIRNFTENKLQIKESKNYAEKFFYDDSLANGVSGNLSYHFYRTLGDHVEGCWCMECNFRKWLLSTELLDFMEAVSGMRYSSYETLFASRYSEGCFLSPHTDQSLGDIGFVFQLTREWRPQWGGVLHFMDDKGKKITGSEVPTFNSLTLFHLPDKVGKWHYVSHVNPGVKSHRLAYTGWYKV